MTDVEALEKKCREVFVSVLYARRRWPDYKIPKHVWRWWRLLSRARAEEAKHLLKGA